VRAFNPWPAASTTWQGQQIKLLRASALTGAAGQAPGVVALVDGAVLVAAGEGLVRLEEVQLAGRAALPARDFVRGQRTFIGSRLGQPST
jgi:methionyl-tRNA formyltransferase